MGSCLRVTEQATALSKMLKLFLFVAAVCAAIASAAEPFSEQVVAGKNNIICAICELIITGIDSAIVDPVNEEMLRERLLSQCKLLDSQLETICQEFVMEYTDDILEVIVAGCLGPNASCNAISACPEE